MTCRLRRRKSCGRPVPIPVWLEVQALSPRSSGDVAARPATLDEHTGRAGGARPRWPGLEPCRSGGVAFWSNLPGVRVGQAFGLPRRASQGLGAPMCFGHAQNRVRRGRDGAIRPTSPQVVGPTLRWGKLDQLLARSTHRLRPSRAVQPASAAEWSIVWVTAKPTAKARRPPGASTTGQRKRSELPW